MTPQSNLGREELKTRLAIQVGEIDVGNVSDVVGTRLVTTDSLKIHGDFATYFARLKLNLRVIVHLLDMPKVAKHIPLELVDGAFVRLYALQTYSPHTRTFEQS